MARPIGSTSKYNTGRNASDTDWCTEDNANTLAKIIEGYWKALGFDVSVWVEPYLGTGKLGGKLLFQIRSNINLRAGG